MKFVLLINLKLLTIANSFLLNIAEHENFSVDKYETVFSLAEKISCSAELSMKKVLLPRDQTRFYGNMEHCLPLLAHG